METPGGSFPPGCSSAYDANAFSMSENANTTYSRLVRPRGLHGHLGAGHGVDPGGRLREAADVRVSVIVAVERDRAQFPRRIDVPAKRDFRERISPHFTRVGFG